MVELIMREDIKKWILVRFFPRYYNKSNYVKVKKKKIDLDNPVTFSEKIRWIMLHSENNKRLAYCADKYLVRKYVEKRGLGHTLNELYAVYDNVDEIDINKLPEQFVLKCVHGSNYNVICKDKEKLNIQEAKEKLRKWQKIKFGYEHGEYFYNLIKPRIVCEKYLEDQNGELLDYKIHCFNGEPKLIQVDFDRFTDKKHTRNFYDINWDKLNVSVLHPQNNIRVLEKPEKMDEMIQYAAKLAKGFPVVRVDFYLVDGAIYFGEMTFAHGCGLELIKPQKYDKIWGEWIKL